MLLSWHSIELSTRRRGSQVTVAEAGTVGRIIGEPTETSVAVKTWDEEALAPMPAWDESTTPGRKLLILLDDDEQILWGGICLRRRSGPSQWTIVDLATVEHYLDRRYVGDLTFTNTQQAQIAAGVLGNIAVDGLAFTVDAPDDGTLRDRSYKDRDDKTGLSILTDLLNINGGLEFTVDIVWADAAHTQVNFVYRTRQRLGTAAALPTEWSMPGCVTDFTYLEDYTRGNGANSVTATSSGEGDDRPFATRSDIQPGWPRYDYRWTPSTSITQTSTLDAYAIAELAQQRDGLTELTLVANLDSAPRLGVDWFLGDDITAALTCPRFPEGTDSDGGRIPGLYRRLRAVGFKIDLAARTIEPTVRQVA